MKTIHSFNDLRQYGINVLTGESCALSRRLLCDLTEAGRSLVIKALGIPDISLSADWNGGDAVGSMLLDRETLRTCAILALFQDPEVFEVWEDQRSIYFMGLTEEDLNRHKEEQAGRFDPSVDYLRTYRLFRNQDRNLHQMSGRIN